MRLKESKLTNPVAVGDIVEYVIETDEFGGKIGEGAIISVMPRKNYVIRKSVNLSRQSHIIAANVDVAYLIVTIDHPETKWQFIDRFLVTCEAYNVPVVILLNKIDLYGESHRPLVDLFEEIYSGAGYMVVEMSATTGESIDWLREECKGRISLFSGVSGVGKSSVLKALDPSLDIKTAEISQSHRQGKHTTTFYQMHRVQSGGYVIDTPGIRGFGLIEIAPEELSLYFPEMFRVAEQCRYKPCTHTHEPDCAVKEGVERGVITPERYYSYLGMLEEEEKYR